MIVLANLTDNSGKHRRNGAGEDSEGDLVSFCYKRKQGVLVRFLLL